jgi:lauroyl/myristoyl acyltransferase
LEGATVQRGPVTEAAPLELEVGRSHPLDVWAHFWRVFANESVQRIVPDRLALSLARCAGRVRWLWPPARRRAIGRVSLTVAGTHRANDVVSLAREELIIQAMRAELLWRPWIASKTPLVGADRLDAALASGRSVILASAHLGAPGGVLAAHGYRDIAAVTGDWLVPKSGQLPGGYAGYKALAIRRRADSANTRLIAAGGTYPLLRSLLEDRVTVLLMVDLPGTMRTRMAGKTAYLRSGLVRLAHETGALVVPLVPLLERAGPSVRVLEPLDARETDGPQELLDRLADVFGEMIVDHPASLEPLAGLPDIWRDDSGSHPIELWRPRHLRDHAVAVRRAAAAARRRPRLVA